MADGQYFNASNIAFLSALWAIKPTSGEEVVQTLWTVILTTWFPPTQAYKIAIKAAVLTDNTQPDGVVFEIRNLASGNPRGSPDLQEKQIFMIECKRPSKDTPTEWDSTAHGQLVPYIEANSNHPGRRLYGAVAIGAKVKFWQWDKDASVPLSALHNGVFDLAEPTHRVGFESFLNHVKQNGWNWAG